MQIKSFWGKYCPQSTLHFWATFVGLLFATSTACIALSPAIVHAETHITDGFLYGNVTWSASSSPYILGTDITVPAGGSLTIEPGVVVSSDSGLTQRPEIYIGGQLNINGTRSSPVIISGISDIDVYHATTTISGAKIYSGDGLRFIYSSATISSSTLVGTPSSAAGEQSVTAAPHGIYSKASVVNVVGSRITGNDIGVFVDPVVPIFMVMNDKSTLPSSLTILPGPNTGGIGNALDDQDLHGDGVAQSAVQVIPSSVVISDSSLAGNVSVAIKNAEQTSTVEAAHNWWGSPNRPTVIGQVNYSPWLDHDPTTEVASTSACCSSVLFIPGLEGTWLYKSSNTLWAPNRNDDVRKLFLNTNGSSTDTSIFSGNPIGSVFGLYGIYGSFMKSMDDLVGAGNIKEWKSFGYDWRKPITGVVAGTEKKATTTASLLDVVENLAKRSFTGKVTIAAHSNGGLVAKYLVKRLSEIGKAGLVDKVISVAVPQLGTPSAVSGLLHGDHQSIAGGLILKSSVARELGQNMSSAYPLLPSREYFSHVVEPVISFASSTTVGVNSGVYARVIKSFNDMSAFIADKFNIRQAPATTDTSQPIKGNKALMSIGDTIQSTLAGMSWPDSVGRWSLVGWNKETPKGLVYSNREKCLTILWYKVNCSTVLAHSETTTSMGDGTVVAPSAAYASDNVVSVDLTKASQAENKNISHANILESSTVQSIVKSIITGQSASVISSAISTVPGTIVGEPDYSKEPVRLVVSVDAEAELHANDSYGRHTGVVAPPPGVDDNIITAYEEKIPGSSFTLNSESDTANNSTISLPDNGQPYTVGVNGGGFGSFTLNMDRVQGSVTLSHNEFTDIPMTPLSVATATIMFTPQPEATSSSANQTSQISVDIDGDGVSDLQATSSAILGGVSSAATTMISTTTMNSLELLKKFTNTVLGKDKRSHDLVSKIDRLKLLWKGKGPSSLKQKPWSRDLVEKLSRKFGHRHMKNLTDVDRRDYTDLLESLIDQFE